MAARFSKVRMVEGRPGVISVKRISGATALKK